MNWVRPSQPQALECVLPNATSSADSKAAWLGTMVVVDQLEEVLNLDADRQQVFCAGLAELAAARRSKDVLVRACDRITSEMPIRVVATVREDFEWQVVRIETLRELCETSRCLVTGVDATSAQELVVEPAKALGYRLENADKAIREVEALLAKDGTALPIVQFALTEWWVRRDEHQKVLSAAAWGELGGVEGALSNVADRHYRNLSDQAQRTLRDLFGRLVLGDRKQWVSAASLASEEERRLMNELAELRLVKRRDEGDGRVGYELAHESLARRWDVLKQWMSERAAEDALIVDLEAEARLWVRQGNPTNRLRLDIVATPAWRMRLGADALAYVDASLAAKRAAEKAEQSERRRRYGATIIALCVILAAVVGYAVQIGEKEAETRRALDIAKEEKRNADEAKEKAIDAEQIAKKATEKEIEARKLVENEREQRKMELEELEQRMTKFRNNAKELEKLAKEVASRRGVTTPAHATSLAPRAGIERVEPPW